MTGAKIGALIFGLGALAGLPLGFLAVVLPFLPGFEESFQEASGHSPQFFYDPGIYSAVAFVILVLPLSTMVVGSVLGWKAIWRREGLVRQQWLEDEAESLVFAEADRPGKKYSMVQTALFMAALVFMVVALLVFLFAILVSISNVIYQADTLRLDLRLARATVGGLAFGWWGVVLVFGAVGLGKIALDRGRWRVTREGLERNQSLKFRHHARTCLTQQQQQQQQQRRARFESPVRQERIEKMTVSLTAAEIRDASLDALRRLGVSEVEMEVSFMELDYLVELVQKGEVEPIVTDDPAGGFGGADLWIATVVPALAAAMDLKRGGILTLGALDAAIGDVMCRVGSPRAKGNRAELVRAIRSALGIAGPPVEG